MLTIIGGFDLARESRSACDKYTKDAKAHSPMQINKIEEQPKNTHEESSRTSFLQRLTPDGSITHMLMLL